MQLDKHQKKPKTSKALLAAIELSKLKDHRELCSQENLSSYLEAPLTSNKLLSLFPEIYEAQVAICENMVTIEIIFHDDADTKKVETELRKIFDDIRSLWPH